MRVMGKVKWFDLLRGLGVISLAQGEADCVVRHSAIRGTLCNVLAVGDPVEFSVIPGECGVEAQDVVRLSASLLPLMLQVN